MESRTKSFAFIACLLLFGGILAWRASAANAQKTGAATRAQLKEDLAQARARISELESQVLSLQADRASLAQQREQEAAASEVSCRTRMADAQTALESVQAELKAAQQRAALFEAENENLRKAQAAPSKVAARSGSSPEGDLDELSRRRDTYLKSVIRRYREIDNEYRALLRDPQQGQGPRANDPAVFHIQSVLAQAEDDLRQIDSLTAKTLLVEKNHEKN
jgi:chromosome segregation ATPase